VYNSEAVQYPWDTVVQQPDRSPRPIPRGTKLIEVFDEVGSELLILGAAGSGKTTMLLDLARDLIARAEENEKLPIPVVFNLSAWAEKLPPLGRWIEDELSYRYAVPRKVGKAWIERKELVLLFDGLDEVNAQHRDACVEAIHRFQQDHGLVNMVVCSRSTEYEALRFQLNLQSAVVLEPLTRHQIETTETLIWSWSETKIWLLGALLIGLGMGLISGLLLGLMGALGGERFMFVRPPGGLIGAQASGLGGYFLDWLVVFSMHCSEPCAAG